MMRPLFFLFFLIHGTLAQQGKHSKKWLTLNGTEPAIIAHGGFSGLFPDSSMDAFGFALQTSLPNVILFCDLQLTKDARGFCLSSLILDNSTTITDALPGGEKSYNVNGGNMRGWFPLDFTYDQLQNVSLVQGLYYRTNAFDGVYPISFIENVTDLKPRQFWLNVQYASFYTQHKLDPALYVEKTLRTIGINYISSPEISFLTTLSGKVDKNKTKLVFRFLDKDKIEPTTNQTYSSILGNLSDVQSFASGILVPKEYIWPVTPGMYLEAATTLVADAHKLGIEVYASLFANDVPASYNYSYDPTAEYLQFIDNSQFSVDGMLTDFPSTASESIACLAHKRNATRPANGPLIISKNGASGVYPGCTDLAYEEAITGGTDIIDCSVQMSKDGVAFCWNSADLSGGTNALNVFMQKSATIPEIQDHSGIFSFDLSWSDIQTLQPQMMSDFLNQGLIRSPANNKKGKFMTLSAFLQLAQTKAVTGILIDIQNAAYLASKKGITITDLISKALSNATFDKQHTQKVLIQSDDTQVLAKFRSNPNFQKVLLINETISGANNKAVDEIRKNAEAVTVRRSSIVQTSESFTEAFTSLVDEMHAANISVYVFVFRNEFTSLAFDYFADPMVELATYIKGLGVDGVISEYPATANAFLRSPCSVQKANDTSFTILPAQAGDLFKITAFATAPAAAPAPVLTIGDVADPPLPAASNASASPPPAAAPPGKSSSAGASIVANTGFSLVALAALWIISPLYAGLI